MASVLRNLWKELLGQLSESSKFRALDSKSSEDIKLMKKMGFADSFIDAAKFQRGFSCDDLQIDLLYYWMQRQNGFHELRPNMLPVGDDGCGNFIYIFDVSKPNSQIIYMSHDPAVLMVIANSMEEFFSQILDVAKKTSNNSEFFSNFMIEFGLSEAAQKISKEGSYNGKNNDLGFHFQKVAGDKVHADFSIAKPLSGISLSFFGKYTEVYHTNIKNVILIKKNEIDGDVKLNRKDRRAVISLLILLPLSYSLLGLFQMAYAKRVMLIFGVLLLSPWVFDFKNYVTNKYFR